MQKEGKEKNGSVNAAAANQGGPAVAPASSRSTVPTTASAPDLQDLSTVELVKQITAEVGHLAQKQIQLAKAELKSDLKSEAVMVGGLSVAAVAGLCTLNLLLVTAIFALSLVLPGWGAGLIVSGSTLVIAGVIALVAWSKRVRSPMARTKRTLREDVQWTKERLV
jgi:hypothetical protein